MAEVIHFKVSDKVRVMVEDAAKELCDDRKLAYKQLNQDMVAVVGARVLKGLNGTKINVPEVKDKDGKVTQAAKTVELKIDWPKEFNQVIFEVLKVCANASALKQKISGEKTTAATEEVVAELQDLA